MKIAEKITQGFLKEGIKGEEDVQVVMYGLRNLISTVCGFMIFLTIGLFFVPFIHAFAICLLCYVLRKNAGGYHADTKWECIVFSILIILLAYLVCEYTKNEQSIMFVMNLIFSIGIFRHAPVDSKNKRLDEDEIIVYRKRTRFILVIYQLIYLAAMLGEKTVLCMDISVIVVIVGSLVCLGKISDL